MRLKEVGTDRKIATGADDVIIAIPTLSSEPG